MNISHPPHPPLNLLCRFFNPCAKTVNNAPHPLPKLPLLRALGLTSQPRAYFSGVTRRRPSCPTIFKKARHPRALAMTISTRFGKLHFIELSTAPAWWSSRMIVASGDSARISYEDVLVCDRSRVQIPARPGVIFFFTLYS